MRRHDEFRELQITAQYVSSSVWQEARWSRGDEQESVMSILCHALEFRFYPGSIWDHLRILRMVDRYVILAAVWRRIGDYKRGSRVQLGHLNLSGPRIPLII